MADHDRIEGSAKNMGGKIKEGAGKLTGDSKLQAEGKADQVEGKVQNRPNAVRESGRRFGLGGPCFQSSLPPQRRSDRPLFLASSTGRHSELKPPSTGRGRQSISCGVDDAAGVRDCGPHCRP